MTKDHSGFLILTHSPHHNLVRLNILKTPHSSFIERAGEWYGKDVEFDVYYAENKKRLKTKFQSVFLKQMNTPSLFYKCDKMSDYDHFLTSIAKRITWEEAVRKTTT